MQKKIKTISESGREINKSKIYKVKAQKQEELPNTKMFPCENNREQHKNVIGWESGCWLGGKSKKDLKNFSEVGVK